MSSTESLREAVHEALSMEMTPTDIYALGLQWDADDESEWGGFELDALAGVVVKLIQAELTKQKDVLLDELEKVYADNYDVDYGLNPRGITDFIAAHRTGGKDE